ncbi:MAG: glycosyltransferase [Cyanobacteria bacterium P01_F01_bin.153]
MTDNTQLPFLSVIAPLYNGRDDLPDLLACLATQTYPSDRLEFLLVDNNSQDDTFEILQKAVPQFKSQGFTLIPLQELDIQSSYAARNCGIFQAKGEIFAFLDGDCRPAPQWLENLVQPFLAGSTPSATPSGKALDSNEIGMVAGEIQALPGNSRLERYADRQDILSQKHTLANSFFPYGQTANLAVRRTIFETIGLFRSHLTTGGDADICWRMQQNTPYKIVLASDAIVRHRHRATLADFRGQFRRYGKSNAYLNQLHGIPLMTPWAASDYIRRPLRWLLREIPIAIAKRFLGRASWGDLDLEMLGTPLELLGMRSRYAGQQSAQLPKRGHEIPPFPGPSLQDSSNETLQEEGV